MCALPQWCVVCCSLIDPPLSALFRCPLSSTASGVIILAAATAVTSPSGRGKGGAKSHRQVNSCGSGLEDPWSPSISVAVKVVPKVIIRLRVAVPGLDIIGILPSRSRQRRSRTLTVFGLDHRVHGTPVSAWSRSRNSASVLESGLDSRDCVGTGTGVRESVESGARVLRSCWNQSRSPAIVLRPDLVSCERVRVFIAAEPPSLKRTAPPNSLF